MRGAQKHGWNLLVASLAGLLVSASAAAQVDTVGGWVADAPEVGSTFSITLSVGPSDEPHVFFARKGSDVDDPDRVVLLLTAVGSIDGGAPRRITISSSTCADAELRARVGEDGTCLVTRVPFGGRWTLLARPLAAPDDGTLRADFAWIRPSGEELLLRSSAPVQARRVDLGGEVNFLSGERELYSVEIPGGIASTTMWVEQRLFTFGFGGVLDIVPVVAALADEHRSGQMAWIGEEDWPTHPTFRNATIWAGGRLNLLSKREERGRLRVVRNDPHGGDNDEDGDGLGHGLEQAVQTCDRQVDRLRFFEEVLVRPGPPVKKGPVIPGPGPIPVPAGEPHVFDCGQLVRPNEAEGQGPYAENPLIRLQDTDQDGHTDYDELLGRDPPDGALARWGAIPYRKDLFIESDYYDPDATSLASCTNASRSLWTAKTTTLDDTGAMVTRLQRELWLQDFAAERTTTPANGVRSRSGAIRTAAVAPRCTSIWGRRRPAWRSTLWTRASWTSGEVVACREGSTGGR